MARIAIVTPAGARNAQRQPPYGAALGRDASRRGPPRSVTLAWQGERCDCSWRCMRGAATIRCCAAATRRPRAAGGHPYRNGSVSRPSRLRRSAPIAGAGRPPDRAAGGRAARSSMPQARKRPASCTSRRPLPRGSPRRRGSSGLWWSGTCARRRIRFAPWPRSRGCRNAAIRSRAARRRARPALGAPGRALDGARAALSLAGQPAPPARTLAWIARSHVLVVSSLTEGGANVIAEAARVGTPVLASRMSGNLGMLGPHYPGYFNVGDDAALAVLLARAATSGIFTRAEARAARTTAAVFPGRRARRASQGAGRSAALIWREAPADPCSSSSTFLRIGSLAQSISP